MNKIIHVKYLLVFVAGILAGILFAPELRAQSADTTSSPASHLRTASNTFDERLTVKVIPGNKTMKYVKIFDIIGNEVASIDLTGKTGSMTFSVDASRLENGIYLCNLYSDKGIIETKKVYWSK
jgi:hypothetical protein